MCESTIWESISSFKVIVTFLESLDFSLLDEGKKPSGQYSKHTITVFKSLKILQHSLLH